MNLTIINFNLQNKVQNKNYDGGSNPQTFAEIISKEKPDIICVQELTDKYQIKLQKYLNNYTFCGLNRFNPNSVWYSHFGEKNAIITNLKILNNKTYSLSKNINKIGKRSFLSIFPRIATVITIEKNKKPITIINTHLDHLSNIARKVQLNYLKKIIKINNKYPIILTGDFNLNNESKLFKRFVIFMQKQNCKLIHIEENTFKTSLLSFVTSPDHIFIPNDFEIVKTDIENNNLSDHKLVKIKIKR